MLAEHRERAIFGVVLALLTGLLSFGSFGTATAAAAAQPASALNVAWSNPVFGGDRLVITQRTRDALGNVVSSELIEQSLTDGRQAVLDNLGQYDFVAADGPWTSWQSNPAYNSSRPNIVNSLRPGANTIETTLTDSYAALGEMKGSTFSVSHSYYGLPALASTVDVSTRATTDYVAAGLNYQYAGASTFTSNGLAMYAYRFTDTSYGFSMYVGAVGSTPHQVSVPAGCTLDRFSASSGNVVVVEGICDNYTPSLLTCTLPCLSFTKLTPPTGLYGSLQEGNFNRSLNTDGRYVTWNGIDSISILDLQQPSSFRTIRTTGWIDGFTMKNGQLAWIETRIRNGVREVVAIRNVIGTDTFTTYAPGKVPITKRAPSQGPVRSHVDISAATLLYDQKEPNGQTTLYTQGVWGSAQSPVVALATTDVTTVRLTGGKAFWTEAANPIDLLKSRSLTGGPVSSIFTPPAVAGSPYARPTFAYDVAGTNAAWSLAPYVLENDLNGYRQSEVFQRTLPSGLISKLTSDETTSMVSQRTVTTSESKTAYLTRDASTYTSSIVVVPVTGRRTNVTLPTAPGVCLNPTDVKLSGSTLAIIADDYCHASSQSVYWCDLPCITWQSIALPPSIRANSSALSGDDMVFLATGPQASSLTSTAIYTLRLRAGDQPTLVTAESGAVSQPHISNDVATWAVTSWDLGVQSGTVYTYSLHNGVLTTIR